ncbi:hypothetical protein [Streptomyces sp. WY228]|uniref:hypothetical protein n=1 Tax=Streptomyces sp. WY228 TaxID=2855836 RepID=UPI001C4ED883|nr:hypothetical protein [Streptomyces sp. WY228]QXQ98959.1 hypothetical protein KV381_23310 [Streptomyces sp. WY228]
MPDRRRRTAFHLPLPERSPLLMRERRSSPPDSSSATGSAGKPQEDNPFAAPPADRPDQPWQPRRPSASNGSDGSDGNGGSEGNGDGSSGDRPAWGSQWSNKQPGRGDGGFGGRPGGNGSGGNGRGGPERGGPGGMRWDPTDPAQRRARYAVLGGIWALFFALFDFTEIALLLGALSTYWAISALRTPLKNTSATDRTGTAGDASGTGNGTGTGSGFGSGTGPGTGATVDGRPGTAPAGPSPASPLATAQGVSGRQQTTAAVGGLVAALLALLIVATTYTVQLVYRDYYTCVNDALTKTAALACNDQLPKPLEPLFGVKE